MRLDMRKSKRCCEALQVYNARSSERFIWSTSANVGPGVGTGCQSPAEAVL